MVRAIYVSFESIRRTSPSWRQLDEQDYPVSVLFREKRFRLKYLFSFQDIINGPRQLIGQYDQRFRLAMFPLQFLTVLSGLEVSSEKEHCRFGEGPPQNSKRGQPAVPFSFFDLT